MRFRLKVVDSKGVERTATIDALDENAALTAAKSKGLFPTSVELISKDSSESSLPTISATQSNATAYASPTITAKHQYKMVQVPPNIEVNEKQWNGAEAATYLETVVNEYAQQGWEFYRVDAIGVKIMPGCLGSLLGQRENIVTYYVITFRR